MSPRMSRCGASRLNDGPQGWCAELGTKVSGTALTRCERAITCGQARSTAGMAGRYARPSLRRIPSTPAVLPSWSCQFDFPQATASVAFMGLRRVLRKAPG